MGLYYQRKNDNPYWMEHSLYKRTAALINDYPRMKRIIADEVFKQSQFDGQPRGGEIGRPTESRAIAIAKYTRDCRAVERTIHTLNSEYQSRYPDFNSLKAFFDYASFSYWTSGTSQSTWFRFRHRFCYLVAEKLQLF